MTPTCRPPVRAALAWLIAALALCASCATQTAAPETPVPERRAAVFAELGPRLLQDYLQPRTRTLARRTTALQRAVTAYCARPGAGTRQAAVARLADTVEAWAHVEFLRFGPLAENNRLEHFHFWPDPRGVVQRQMRAVLAAADPTVLANARLRQQSAAVQGLPALEYALYADDAEQLIASGSAAGRYRCAWAGAVAGNLTTLAGEIAAGWEHGAPAAAGFAHPDPQQAVWRSTDEVATETLKALATALHVIHDQKLAPAMGDSAAQARESLLPLWRSGLTARYLAAGLQGLEAFHATARLGAALPADARWIDTSVSDELRRAQSDMRELSGIPGARALTDEEPRTRLLHARLLLTNARAIVEENLAPALEVDLGFNSLDGD